MNTVTNELDSQSLFAVKIHGLKTVEALRGVTIDSAYTGVLIVWQIAYPLSARSVKATAISAYRGELGYRRADTHEGSSRLEWIAEMIQINSSKDDPCTILCKIEDDLKITGLNLEKLDLIYSNNFMILDGD